MSFFILKNGKLKNLSFPYLSHDSGRRLEVTLAPHSPQKKEVLKSDQTFVIEIMSKPAITLDYQATVKEALELFDKIGTRHLILSKGDDIKGMISDRDITWIKKLENDHATMVSKYMSDLLLVCHEETVIDFVAKVMVHEKISALPVINDKHQVTGIVTHSDLLRWIYE